MKPIKIIYILSVFVCSLLINPAAQAEFQTADTTISALKYIGQNILQHNQEFKGTTIGGLSGIDYDPETNLYYLLSDDRSVINPARFYTANIDISATGIEAITFRDVFFLRQPNDSLYKSPTVAPHGAIDPEAIRYDRKNKHLIWTSEGERRMISKEKVLIDPAIIISFQDGKHKGKYPIPSNLKMSMEKTGPRQNSALEGVTLNPTFTKLFAGIEEPLYQDGPAAEVDKPNALTRIYEFDTHSHHNTAQYIYPLEAVAYASIPPHTFKVNGVSEILYVSKHKLLVIERSFSTGRLSCTIKIFLADFSKAVNIKDKESLLPSDLAQAATKSLLLNMDDLGIYIDNIECVTFGPKLPNGHNTLIFVADNNFLPTEQSQFFLFEIIP